MNVGMYGMNDEDDDFQSADSSPAVSRHHELWVYESDIGKGGFGVVKLYKHKVRTIPMCFPCFYPFCL